MPIGGFNTAGDHVVLDGVNEQFLKFAGALDTVHQLLFERQMMITSARDGQHAPGSLHTAGKAIDVRTKDKTELANMTFLTVLGWMSSHTPITVFDERNLPGEGHIHIEWHGV
jgi:hypothetical protein